MSDGRRRPVRPRRGPSGRLWLGLGAVLSGSLLLLFLLPIAALLAYAPPSRWLAAAENVAVQQSIGLTLYASALAVLGSALLAVPLGYLLARRRFPGRGIVESVVTLPVVVPHLMVGLGLFFLLAVPTAPLRAVTVALGLPIYDSIAGVVLVMVVVSAPYTVVASQLAFRAVDPRVVEASRALGAGPAAAFLTVTLPIAGRGIVAGLLLTWARAVSEIGGLLILAAYVFPGGPYAGPVASPISVYVYQLFQNGNLTDAAAVSSFFLLIAFAIFLGVRLAERTAWVPWRHGELGP
ncbi:Binding-protein-dependent transport system inner membrane component [mine drainage metagenome]|uniref:Binding-protein-dependent transport system inner membrane component n=1 Tax=mine drainage metagenome TaxID=410659 RepID=T1CB02_9ZZZZ